MRSPISTAAALLAGVALALSGCSTAPPAAPATAGGGTLTFLSPFPKEQAEPLIAQFEKDNPGSKINVSYYGPDTQQLLVTQLAAHTAPDVMYMNPGAGQPTAVGTLAAAGYLEDLSDSPWAGKIPEEFKKFLSYEGKVYAFPSTTYGLGALYNETALASAGLKAPTTWSDVIKFCGDAKAAGVAAYALGANEQWIAQLITYALVSTLVDTPKPTFNENVGQGALFTESAWVSALRKYSEMDAAKCFQNNATGTDGAASWKLLGEGKALGVVQVTAVLGAIEDVSAPGTKYTLLPFPANDDPSSTSMPSSLSSTMGINAKAKNPVLAHKWVDWMSEPAQLNQLAAAQAGSLPTIADGSFDVPSVLTVYQDLANEGRVTPIPDSLWPNPKIAAAHMTGVQALLLGTTTPEGIAKDMDSAASKK